MADMIHFYRNFDVTGEDIVVSESRYEKVLEEKWGVSPDKILIDSRIQEEERDGATSSKYLLGGTFEPELLSSPMDIYVNYQRFANSVILIAGDKSVRLVPYLLLGFVPLVMHPWLQDQDHQYMWEDNFTLDMDKLSILPRYVRRATPILSNKYQAPSYCQTDTFVHRNDVEEKFGIKAETLTIEELWRKVWIT